MLRPISLILFLCALMCNQTAFAQPDYKAIDSYAKKAPAALSFNHKLLTHYLCDKYSSDEEKVRSLSTWIMTHIKYDVHMYQTGRLKKFKPDKILRRRKAICQGYSDLFEAMCREAGIPVKTVIGYDKGATYEPLDFFVRDQHCWNAVQLGDGWHPIDLTWAAGRLEPRKQIIRRLLYFFFNVPFRQKYRFKGEPDYHYYLTDPAAFSVDHLSTFPWWQMNTEKVEIKTFEKDTTFILPYRAAAGDGPGTQVSVPDYETITEPLCYLKLGKAAHEFNDKNFRVLAEYKSMYAYTWFTKVRKSDSLENSERYDVYDSCKTIFEEAAADTRTYLKWSRKEWTARKQKNQEYKTMFQHHDKRIIRGVRNVIKQNLAFNDRVAKDLSVLRKERKNLELHEVTIRDLKNRGKFKPVAPEQLSALIGLAQRKQDSIQTHQHNLRSQDSAERESFKLIQHQNELLAARGQIATETAGNKLWLKMIFNWRYKHWLDSLHHFQNNNIHERDSLNALRAEYLNGFEKRHLHAAETRSRINTMYSHKFQLFQIAAASGSPNMMDSITKVESDWKEFLDVQSKKLTQINALLADEKRDIAWMNQRMRLENILSNYDIAVQGMLTRHLNHQYHHEYKQERKRVSAQLKNLKRSRIYVRQEMKKVREKIRQEEAEARKQNGI